MDPFRKLRSFSQWKNGMDINAVDETSYTIHHQKEFLKYVGNVYCARNRCLPVIKPESILKNTPFPFTIASWSGQSSYDAYDLSSNGEQYIMPKNEAETTSGWSNHASRILTVTRLYFNSQHRSPKNWGQINPNLNDYHSDPLEIGSTFWIPDITDWRRQQEERHSMYANLSNVARDIFSIPPHGVSVGVSVSFGQDVIGCGDSKTIGENLRKNVIVRLFARANNGILSGDHRALGMETTENYLETNREAEERIWQRMADVHDFLEMWKGSWNLCATQKEYHTRNQ